MRRTIGILLLGIGCSKTESTDTAAAVDSAAPTTGDTSTAPTDSGTAPTVPLDGSLRVVQLVPDAGTLDWFLDDGETPWLSGAPFLTSTNWGAVPAGAHTLSIGPTGEGPGAAQRSIGLEIAAETTYSVAAYGAVSAASVGLLALVDDRAGIPAGASRYQFAHVADGLGVLDLRDEDAGTLLLAGLDFADHAAVDWAAGPHAIGVDDDGDGSSDGTIDVPDYGAGVLLDVYLTLDLAGPLLVVHREDGAIDVFRPNVPMRLGRLR